MRTIVFRLMLALAAFTVVPNALAADTDSGNFFLNAKFGRMSNNSEWGDTGPSTQTHSSGGVSGGYLWKLDSGSSLGLELGYMDFGHISDGNDANEFTTETASANAMTVGINYQYPFGADEAWYAQARAGLMRAKLDATLTFDMGGPPSTSTGSSHEGGVYFGVGIGRQITQRFSLTLAYAIYGASGSSIQLSPTWLGLEAEYRF
jgi:hemolysin activation/secretion protein